MKCPCHSKESYEVCCKPYHEGKLAEDALKLMRSRYSAYALKLIDYVIDTTHPDCLYYQEDREGWKEDLLTFCEQTKFKDLDIIDVHLEPRMAFITFVVHMDQEGKDVTFTERSYFVFEHEKWLYRDGIVKPGVHTNSEMLEG